MDREKDGIRNFELDPDLSGRSLGEDRSGNERKRANSGLSRDAERQFETFVSRVTKMPLRFFVEKLAEWLDFSRNMVYLLVETG